MAIDKLVFETAYKDLVELTKRRNSEDELSFESGYWDDEEGYKRDFWEEAREVMELNEWPKHRGDVNYILSRVYKPFWLTMRGTNRPQNLVSEENYSRLDKKVFQGKEKLRKEAADIFFEIFYGNNDKEAFERLAYIIKGKVKDDPFSVVAFYFFLKDKTPDGDYQYVPVRKDGTGKRLNVIHQNPTCVQDCTWDNYVKYIDIVKELQQLLRQYHSEASLLDAQSFLWMLWLVVEHRENKKWITTRLNPSITKIQTPEDNNGKAGVAANDAEDNNIHNDLKLKRYIEEIERPTLEGKEKKVIVKARVNQGTFREQLLGKYKSCCLCGLANRDLLIASHIKPWFVSEAGEKMETDNGLLLCPNHDKLFDGGFISFDDGGRVIISDRLSEEDRQFMNVTEDMYIAATEKMRQYMKYHRENVFKKG